MYVRARIFSTRVKVPWMREEKRSASWNMPLLANKLNQFQRFLFGASILAKKGLSLFSIQESPTPYNKTTQGDKVQHLETETETSNNDDLLAETLLIQVDRARRQDKEITRTTKNSRKATSMIEDVESIPLQPTTHPIHMQEPDITHEIETVDITAPASGATLAGNGHES